MRNPIQSLLFKNSPISYKVPPVILSSLNTRWIAMKHCRRHLRQICQEWYKPDAETLLEELNLIQWEVIGGDQRIQPYPIVACIESEGVTVGVVSGHPNYVHEHVFIEYLAVHPGYRADSDTVQAVVKSLVDAAIDYSLELGFRGWVACDADTKYLHMLQHYGFHPSDPFTFRKMGYFA